MGIKSICPKCGKMGTQAITYHPNKANSKFNYLEMIHNKKERCYIGRIRTTEEAMGEFEKKSTEEELSVTLTNISKEIRDLIRSYSPNTAVRIHVISEKLIEILRKHGY